MLFGIISLAWLPLVIDCCSICSQSASPALSRTAVEEERRWLSFVGHSSVWDLRLCPRTHLTGAPVPGSLLKTHPLLCDAGGLGQGLRTSISSTFSGAVAAAAGPRSHLPRAPQPQRFPTVQEELASLVTPRDPECGLAISTTVPCVVPAL